MVVSPRLGFLGFSRLFSETLTGKFSDCISVIPETRRIRQYRTQVWSGCLETDRFRKLWHYYQSLFYYSRINFAIIDLGNNIISKYYYRKRSKLLRLVRHDFNHMAFGCIRVQYKQSRCYLSLLKCSRKRSFFYITVTWYDDVCVKSLPGHSIFASRTKKSN